MNRLPDEIWIQIFDYLDPEQLLRIQAVCRSLRKVARDASLWRSKCFERAPSAVRAFSNGDSLSELLNGLSLSPQNADGKSQSAEDPASIVRMSRRARAIGKWDLTESSERLDWYTEYVGRHAPLHTEWIGSKPNNEIRSIALFHGAQKVLGAMEDGSIHIWDVTTADNGRRNLYQRGSSSSGLLFANLCEANEPSSSNASLKQLNLGTAVDSTVVHDHSQKAYIATEEFLNEVDLNEMRVVSQQKFAWRITALSQQAGNELPLMVGTSFSLNMHDPRMPLTHQTNGKEDLTDTHPHEENTAFLPNYAKSWLEGRTRTRLQRPFRTQFSATPQPSESWRTRHRCVPEVYAQIEPGPQTILHRGIHEILVAGRMPSILFYDKRSFPKLESVIHSGARLSSLSILEQPPRASTSTSAEATLIAAGEYHGRGSLELYELPHTRPNDRQATYDEPAEEPPSPSNVDTSLADTVSSDTPFSHRNRQSSSAAKLLSVATQGARIVFSDSEGGLKWVERDGRGLARRWNINNYQYTHEGGALIGESAARKILAFPADEYHSAKSNDVAGMKRGDGDLLIWTGSDIGLVTNKVKWAGHDELVAAFEEKMTLDESSDGQARRGSAEDERKKEEEYARMMRRALERQADERRFLARFGRMGGW